MVTDLTAVFWQIPVKKQDRFKTAFACEGGFFDWKRMPFGLCNATATFQRMMVKALCSVELREEKSSPVLYRRCGHRD